MATPGRAPQAYRQAQVMGSDRRQLVVLMCRALERYLARAEQAIRGGEFEAKADALAKAHAVLSELICSLNDETGGEVAGGLRRLYLSMQGQIVDVDLGDDLELLAEVTEMARLLAQTWEEALRRCAREQGVAQVA